MTELYLYHKKHSDKMYMFGFSHISDEWEIRNLIAANTELYIDIYTNEFFAEEVA